MVILKPRFSTPVKDYGVVAGVIVTYDNPGSSNFTYTVFVRQVIHRKSAAGSNQGT